MKAKNYNTKCFNEECQGRMSRGVCVLPDFIAKDAGCRIPEKGGKRLDSRTPSLPQERPKAAPKP